MLRKLKKLCPSMYDYYQHICRLKVIHNIKFMKKLTNDQIKTQLENTYFKKIGHQLDWNNLERYTAKMQWEKLYHNDSIKTQLADKYLVRDWVAKKIGNNFLIPLLGVWNNFEEINFSRLPEQFVIKTNHGSGSVMIIKDKSKFNYKSAKRKFDDWMKIDFSYTTSFEMHYSKIDRKIIIEKYLESDLGELEDYKFLCFDGKPKFCWVDLGRFSTHTRTVFDMEWKVQPWTQGNYKISTIDIPKPKNYDLMIELATILSEGFQHVRVDFYNVGGQIYFGEMTFTNGSGLDPIIPDEYDKILGSYWNIGQ